MGHAGAKLEELTNALVDAFPERRRLEEMVRFKLDENLNNLAPNDDLRGTVFKLVLWADAQGKVGQLVKAAYAANENNDSIRSIFEQLPGWLVEPANFDRRNISTHPEPMQETPSQSFLGPKPTGYFRARVEPVVKATMKRSYPLLATNSKYADLEISLERQDADSFAGEFRFALPDAEVYLVHKIENLSIAIGELQQLNQDAAAYGSRLGKDFFTIRQFGEALAVVKSKGVDLRFRLSLAPHAGDLQALRWETLADPTVQPTGAPLLMSDRILFSRYVNSGDWRQITPRAKGDLRALVIVANPSGLDTERFAPIDVPGEVARARDGMAGIKQIDVLGDKDRATEANVRARLQTGPDILYLVCHGALVDGKPMLWLEDEAGKAFRVAGAKLESWLYDLKQPPRLVVLVSCQSAGIGEGDALGALGPMLGEAGIPAVLAMPGNVTVATIEAFMPVFFRELQRDGQIDRAVAVARGAVRERPDAWSPVLYMRLKSGRLWYTPGFASDRYGRASEKWPPVLNQIGGGTCTPVLGPELAESLFGSRLELAQKWATDYGLPVAPGYQTDFARVAQVLAVEQGPTSLTLEFEKFIGEALLQRSPSNVKITRLDQLISIVGMEARERDPAEPHNVLAGLPIPVFVTTNFDDLLTDALRATGKEPRVELYPWNDFADWPPARGETEPDYYPTVEKPLVYHLFGHLDIRDSLVLTEDDHVDFLVHLVKNDNLIPSSVRNALENTALLFLGWGLDAWHSRALVRTIMGMTTRVRRSRSMHLIQQIKPPGADYADQERLRGYFESYLDALDLSIYTGSVEDFLKELQGFWEAVTATASSSR